MFFFFRVLSLAQLSARVLWREDGVVTPMIFSPLEGLSDNVFAVCRSEFGLEFSVVDPSKVS